MAEITLLLQRWEEGEPAALEELMPMVYPHLREVAAAYIRRERSPDLLQATALVHELYIRLLNQKKASWNDRSHFYAFAARMMRMILIDHARSNLSEMHGGNMPRVPLSDDLLWVDIGSHSLLELNRALDELQAIDPNKVKLVEMRYFLGCTAEETAELAQVSKATVDRELRFVVERHSDSNTYQHWSVSSGSWVTGWTIDWVIEPQWDPSTGRIEATVPLSAVSRLGPTFQNDWADLLITLASFDTTSSTWKDGDTMLIHYRLSTSSDAWIYGNIEY